MSTDLSKEMYMVRTPLCGICGEEGVVTVPYLGFLEWNFGKLVQDAFPDLDLATREQMISGTHPKCWDEMTGGQ
jgi:hypothetical protein